MPFGCLLKTLGAVNEVWQLQNGTLSCLRSGLFVLNEFLIFVIEF